MGYTVVKLKESTKQLLEQFVETAHKEGVAGIELGVWKSGDRYLINAGELGLNSENRLVAVRLGKDIIILFVKENGN